MIENNNKEIPITRQCELLGISRSGYYYQPKMISPYNLHLMNLIDEQYTRMPFYGVNRMTAYLIRQGYQVNVKRVRRLMRIMGLEAIYPKRSLSIPSKDYGKYPYLLKDIIIGHPNQVWCADITYIRMAKGFLYLIAIMDWYSRYVLSWKLSNTLDVSFCTEALYDALSISTPEIFNTDQGSQFTSKEWIEILKSHNIEISMDSRGRVFDNIFIERLWRSVKYEEVYINNYETVKDAIRGLTRYFMLYNNERLHESLGYMTPYEVYYKYDRRINIAS